MNELNKTSDTQPLTAAVVIHQGLQCVAASTTQIADHIRTDATDIPTAIESAKAVSKQFTDLIDRASAFAKECRRLRETAEEVERATEWIGKKYCGGGVSVNNSFGRVIGSFQDL
jgi:methyl-accepting chemotaxis protein